MQFSREAMKKVFAVEGIVITPEIDALLDLRPHLTHEEWIRRVLAYATRKPPT